MGVQNMDKRKRNAIVKALTNAGWGDVIMTDWEYDGDLKLNAEEWIEGKGLAGDYWYATSDDFGIHIGIGAILQKYGCYAEWYDASVIAVVRG
jgi:hypothetical protein